MDENTLDTIQLQKWVVQMREGDKSAPNELIQGVCGRLERLTRKMLHNDPRVHRWEQTGDVLQNAFVRLLRALETVTPNSIREFYGLASQQIRRELIDLARHYYGPQGTGANYESRCGKGSQEMPLEQCQDTSRNPSRLAEFTEFLEQIANLPEKEKIVFELHYYQGKTQRDIAKLLEINEETAGRRCRSAKLKLGQWLRGQNSGG